MGILKYFSPDDGLHFVNRKRILVDSEFQWKYTGYLLGAVTLAILFAGGTCYYFLQQNYSIFYKLSYMHSPDLIENLAREQLWLNSFLFSTIVGLITFTLFIGLRMTARIAGPVIALKKHLRELTKGKFSADPLHVRSDDEFHDLIDTYNYFALFLKAQVKADLERLEEAFKSSYDSWAQQQLAEMIAEKRQQLNVPDEASHSTRDSHHAA
jgi:HAMP domain-containing protein